MLLHDRQHKVALSIKDDALKSILQPIFVLQAVVTFTVK